MPPMLQTSVNSAQSAGFNTDMTASVSSPVARTKQETQYDLKPISARISHPLILETSCADEVLDIDPESMTLLAELELLFPHDPQVCQLLLPILQGEALTERRRFEIEACFKYPHVLDLQEAYVKRALGEELSKFEELLLRRMDGAAVSEVYQQG